jgi:hypothetical protein
MTLILPPTSVIRVSRADFDPARFAEADRMTRDRDLPDPGDQSSFRSCRVFRGRFADRFDGACKRVESDAHAQQMDSLQEMVMNARRDAEAVGVGFTPIVDYPVAWHI